MHSTTIKINNELALFNFAQRCVNLLNQLNLNQAYKISPFVIHLRGQLGAGKTTLVRAFLQALGYRGTVKSPTYGLVETYPDLPQSIIHLDLYRIEQISELDHLGLRDYLSEESEKRQIWFIEWPKEHPDLPAVDLDIELKPLWDQGDDRNNRCTTKRMLHLTGISRQGADFVRALKSE